MISHANTPSNLGNDSSQEAAEFIFENSRFSGALFNNHERTEGGPLMTGSVTIGGRQFGLSAFKKTPEGGKKAYLSLSLGDKDGLHYYGKLFRSEPGRSASAPHYSGFVTVLACGGETRYSDAEWDAAPRLQVCGWRERNADGGARISLVVAAREIGEDELPF